MRILFEYECELTCLEIISANYDHDIFDEEENPTEGMMVYTMREVYAIPMNLEKTNMILHELLRNGFAVISRNMISDSIRWYDPETNSFE